MCIHIYLYICVYMSCVFVYMYVCIYMYIYMNRAFYALIIFLVTI